MSYSLHAHGCCGALWGYLHRVWAKFCGTDKSFLGLWWGVRGSLVWVRWSPVIASRCMWLCVSTRGKTGQSVKEDLLRSSKTKHYSSGPWRSIWLGFTFDIFFGCNFYTFLGNITRSVLLSRFLLIPISSSSLPL